LQNAKKGKKEGEGGGKDKPKTFLEFHYPDGVGPDVDLI
jgi:hypothetical protein